MIRQAANDPDTILSGGPSTSSGFLLWRVQNRWRSAVTEALAPHELTHVQFALLGSLLWLTEHEGLEPTQNEIAEHAGTDPTMTSQVLRTLERRKLVSRRPSREDARARVVRLLAAGRELAIRAIVIVRAVDASFIDANVGDPVGFRRALAQLLAAPILPPAHRDGR